MKRFKCFADWRELPVIMSPATVATVLGVCTPTILAQLRAGELPGVKIGKQWRISKAALMAHLGEEGLES